MGVNDYQVGGDHYKREYQHWDFVLDTGIGYFEGNATKYVVRWRHKGGRQDLMKARHYLNKLIENERRAARPRLPINRTNANEEITRAEAVRRLAAAYDLTAEEAAICSKLASWCDLEDLFEVRFALMQITPVQLEDSNRHAERA